MKGKYKDFKEIKDKNVKIKQKKGIFKNLDEKKEIEFKKKMDYIALFLSLIILLIL